MSSATWAMKTLAAILAVASCTVSYAADTAPATAEEPAAAQERPTEAVTPPPQCNPNAVVWRSPEPPANPEAGDVWVSPRDGKAMGFVPAGEFSMGSPQGEGDADEHPQRRVDLDAFWVDKTEVTNAEYQRFMQATGRAAPRYWGDEGFSRPDQPVVGVDWEDAAAYAQWAGKRLPTAAEWEKAARGTDGRRYPWGDAWDVKSTRRCNFADRNTSDPWSDPDVDDGYARTAPVGSYPLGACPYGCLDMAGNVWEWCADWHREDYYASAPARNPTGPASGSSRELRGGSWIFGEKYVRCADRYFKRPSLRSSTIGFRCAMRAAGAMQVNMPGCSRIAAAPRHQP